MEHAYEAPKVYTLGTVEELTQAADDKCNGSGDFALPQIITPFQDGCP